MTPHVISTVPIIDSVSAVALSLFSFQVDITLLTDGGQSVTLYTVSVYIYVDVTPYIMYILHVCVHVCWRCYMCIHTCHALCVGVVHIGLVHY